MKVIFLQDVSSVARAGEIKDVADGYGRNFLLPRKLAVQTSPGALREAEQQLKRVARRHAQTEAELAELANQLSGKEVVLKVRAGTKERLFGSVTAADIAAELERAFGLVVDKRKIELEEAIRQIGSYDVAIRLGKDILSQIKVTVTEESA